MNGGLNAWSEVEAKTENVLALTGERIFNRPTSLSFIELDGATMLDGCWKSTVTVMLCDDEVSLGGSLPAKHARVRLVAEDKRERTIGPILFLAIHLYGRVRGG